MKKPWAISPTKGKKLPRLWIEAAAIARSGPNHWNWKGGITSEHERIRKSTEYKEWRTSVYKRDNYTCIVCKKRTNRLEADHIMPFALFPKVRLDILNGRTVCHSCHNEVGANSRMIQIILKKILSFRPSKNYTN